MRSEGLSIIKDTKSPPPEKKKQNPNTGAILMRLIRSSFNLNQTCLDSIQLNLHQKSFFLNSHSGIDKGT